MIYVKLQKKSIYPGGISLNNCAGLRDCIKRLGHAMQMVSGEQALGQLLTSKCYRQLILLSN
jgi:hypothetical protein